MCNGFPAHKQKHHRYRYHVIHTQNLYSF